jgi:Glycosyltransferase family 87
VAGFAAAAVAGIDLCWSITTGGDILAARGAILVRLAVWSVVWVAGVACALRLPRRVALPAIFVVAVALRLTALAGPPVLSDDLFRYAWDGRVQAAGIDPYRYQPTHSYLRPLREPWLWPDDAGCAELGRAPHCSRINRATVRTIYPPVAQAWFAAVYRLGGIDAEHKAWQVAGLVGDMALVGLLPLVLRAWKRDARWTALYALSPFPVLEVVNNGHVDGLAALLVVGALLAAARRRPAWAGALIGAATLVKLYPALLVVGLAGAAVVSTDAGRRWWRARGWLPDLIRGGAAAGAVVVIGYLPHVLAVGVKVLGYLPGYLREEKYDSGGRFLLASLLHLPVVPAAAIAGLGLAAVIVWVLRARPPAPRACAALIGALLLATTPVQPWYAVTLLAVATVAVAPAWTLVVAAACPYFFAVILDSPHTIAIGRLSYGLALVGVAASAVAARRRRRAGELAP